MACVQALPCHFHPWAFFMSTTELIRTFLTDRLGVQPDQIQPGAALAELGVGDHERGELTARGTDLDDVVGRDHAGL